MKPSPSERAGSLKQKQDLREFFKWCYLRLCFRSPTFRTTYFYIIKISSRLPPRSIHFHCIVLHPYIIFFNHNVFKCVMLFQLISSWNLLKELYPGIILTVVKMNQRISFATF